MSEQEGGIDFFAEPVAQSEDSLTRLRELADEQTILEGEVEKMQLDLEKKKQELEKVAQGKIPELMAELQIEKFTLADGFEISIKEKLNASIKAHDKPAAYQWIKDNGYGGIIKTGVEIAFDKGEIDKAEKLVAELAEKGFAAEANESIHSATLSSFVRERMAEAGDEGSLDEEQEADAPAAESDGFDDEPVEGDDKRSPFPKDLFGIFVYKRAEIKAPKAKKGKK